MGRAQVKDGQKHFDFVYRLNTDLIHVGGGAVKNESMKQASEAEGKNTCVAGATGWGWCRVFLVRDIQYIYFYTTRRSRHAGRDVLH